MASEAALKLNGLDQGQEQQPRQQEDDREEKDNSQQSPGQQGKQALGNAKKAIDTGKKIYNTAQKTVKVAKATVQAARAAALLANPWVLGAIGIALAILLIYLLFFQGGDSSDTDFVENQPVASSLPGAPGEKPSIPGVTVILKGPPERENGQDIIYDVTVLYDPAVAKVPIENIVLFDTVPNNATFVETDGVQAADSTPTTVTWSLKDPTNQKLFHITLHPTASDTYVINSIGVRLAAGATGGSSTDSEEFLALFTGQGRNTSALGGRSAFVSTIIANSSGLPLSGKESYLGQIYDAGIKYNVNPLIIAGVWGTESGFDTLATYPFGCLNPTDAGFAENVTCSAGSLNQLMSSYESHSAGGSLEIPATTGNTCIYTDPFIYAYEMYTPICHAIDSNGTARGNMVSFYKKLKGI